MQSLNRNFYKELPEIKDFSDILELEHYYEIPDDWLIVATDIRGSTEAIRDGKYRSVNMAGACAIAAICNEFSDLDIPFVFGGDGVTLAIPDVGRDHIMGLLKFCKQATKSVFGLELAAGCRLMGELRENGKEIKIGKFRLSEHVKQAIFWGSGVDYIEEVIKLPENDLDKFSMVEADFNGLECRWNEIPSEKDEILSIIIKSVIEDENLRSRFYKDCFEKIEAIYGSADQYAPVKEHRMTLTSSPKMLRSETLIRSYPSNLFKKIIYFVKLCYLQFAGHCLMKNRVETKNTNWGNYKSDFVRNADFRKFSDGLKLVVSGTVDQRFELRSYLDDQNRKGTLVFGTHSSPASMTTCFVTDYQGQHIHFIDGTEGGYAAASVELKEQIKELKEKRTPSNLII